MTRVVFLGLLAAAALAACDGNHDDPPPGPRPNSGGLVTIDAETPVFPASDAANASDVTEAGDARAD